MVNFDNPECGMDCKNFMKEGCNYKCPGFMKMFGNPTGESKKTDKKEQEKK